MRGGATEVNETQKWATSKKSLRTTGLDGQLQEMILKAPYAALARCVAPVRMYGVCLCLGMSSISGIYTARREILGLLFRKAMRHVVTQCTRTGPLLT
jgi:hypothetical protein